MNVLNQGTALDALIQQQGAQGRGLDCVGSNLDTTLLSYMTLTILLNFSVPLLPPPQNTMKEFIRQSCFESPMPITSEVFLSNRAWCKINIY